MRLSDIGVTPGKEKQFNKKGIYSAEDLVRWLPHKYNDISVISGIIENFDAASTVAYVDDIKYYDNKIPLVMAICTDIYCGERIYVSWFRQAYLYQKMYPLRGKKVLISGKMQYDTEYHHYSISNPFLFTDDIDSNLKIYPIYSKIPGMSSNYLSATMQSTLRLAEVSQETLPSRILNEYGLCSTEIMLKELHAPTTMTELRKAQKRLLFDDLLYFAARMTYASRKQSCGSQYNLRSIKNVKAILSTLPYSLTDDQTGALKEMFDSMRHGVRINALLQGDVGVGKTIVAFLLMVAMVDSGYQAALMAPTQVLAQQHYEDLCKLVSPYGVRVAFVGGVPMKKKERDALYSDIASGTCQIVVGTHAVLNHDIRFKNLALTIVDEEHKFGVLQRQALVEKATMGVHAVTMSATPIPRSLAQVVYGSNIQLYTLKTMPCGRLPVKTCISGNIKKIQEFLLKELNAGRQGYIVCPMIEDSDAMENVQSVESLYRIYQDYLSAHGFIIQVLTGNTKKEETENILRDFKDGKTHVLLATTVIEVGVNVPNASVMIIHNAERFGLSGLHQLRGRVGRGTLQSYCILCSQDTTNPRLQVMCQTTDGFKIAEEDLKLRGAGDFLGTRQSGDEKYLSLMLANPEMYQHAKKAATDLLDTGDSCRFMETFLHDVNEDEA